MLLSLINQPWQESILNWSRELLRIFATRPITRWQMMTIYEIVLSTTSDRPVSRATQDSRSISLRPESGNGVKTRSDPSVWEHVMGFFKFKCINSIFLLLALSILIFILFLIRVEKQWSWFSIYSITILTMKKSIKTARKWCENSKKITGSECHEMLQKKLSKLGISVVSENDYESTKTGEKWGVDVVFLGK